MTISGEPVRHGVVPVRHAVIDERDQLVLVERTVLDRSQIDIERVYHRSVLLMTDSTTVSDSGRRDIERVTDARERKRARETVRIRVIVANDEQRVALGEQRIERPVLDLPIIEHG